MPFSLSAVLRPLSRAVTYTRWLHLLIASVAGVLVGFLYNKPFFAGGWLTWLWMAVLPLPLLLLAALIPVVRRVEGLQAQLLLTPGPHGLEARAASGIATTPSGSWSDRGRTAVWLLLRLEAGVALSALTAQLPLLAGAFAMAAAGRPTRLKGLPAIEAPHWWYGLLAPLPLVLLAAVAVGAGSLTAAAARLLLGPSAAERLTELEARTERLLEHNRLAQELHDAIGHALTVTVLQAGAARTAGSPEFTERALAAIEDTGREALADLERALRLLREDAPGPAGRPALTDTERLLESARAAGADLRAELSGPLERLPGPVSREGYRMVQESLTNVLRHAGPVPVSVRIAADADALELEVRNPLPVTSPNPGSGGRGLRGIRERAALLGGEAETGPDGGEWRVRARLPLRQLGPVRATICGAR
ncbi:histidine kinase [Streptomyces sp. Je 1-4]|uniref:sensor histidine kinase n=1 Tax=Streptomyces TaxID=1883 RepID=UPI0021D8E160|nr:MULTISPECIES: histidine kinase [unclassified Streptomyces]UYB38369.1 histidine kinase [Streptomyces sp. Je 1-4]UZQ34323.1 histidine kinase [Streptomyces sp. Je 1-4] [Streptomyces sp. Je 1-4 4N24]UZQ41741.1 histidine kinase [Streptomyces sp. Je 1-4] [Streptomyces sp. Je 1-4 4N24_ara]